MHWLKLRNSLREYALEKRRPDIPCTSHKQCCIDDRGKQLTRDQPDGLHKVLIMLRIYFKELA
jgi:hypothetical protein